MSTVERLKLDAFGRQVSNALSSTRDISLLAQIDETIEAVADEVVKFQSLALMTDHFIEVLQKAAIPDVSGLAELQLMFARSIEIVASYHQNQIIKRQSAIEDKRLTNEDGIVDAYDTLIQQVAQFHNNLSSLSWLLGEHLAEADTTMPETFTSADALFKAIGV